MFRDTKEELERLEQLLREEETEEVEVPQEEEEDYSQFLQEEGEAPQGPVVYQNFSNGYGSQLRNYATGYKAYNADKTDTDLEQLSQEVLEEKKSPAIWLVAAVLGLMAAVLGVIIWIYAGGLF